MSEFKFKTPAGQTIDRKMYLCCGNSGTYAAPKWGKLGKRVEDSSAEMDWGEETKQDILGDTYTTMKTPVVSQAFDPCELDAGDEYQQKVWNLAVVDQDAPALCNQDLLRIHLYAVDEQGNAFAERYPASMVKPSSLGGEGGGSLTMPIDVTFGGTRETGTASVAEDGTITFTPKGGGRTLMKELKFETGIVEMPVNGGRAIRFNPSDVGFLDTLFGLLGKIEAIEADTEKKRGKTDDLAKIFDYTRASDKRMREAMDSVFGEGFCDEVFSGIRLTAMADGLTVLENFIFAIVDEMDQSVRDNLAKRNDRIAKYTAKYQARKNVVPWRELLPTGVEVGGVEYEIRSDYRAVLDICAALSDPELDGRERAVVR